MKVEKNMSLWALAWPVMIEMFLQFAIGTADTFMVSRISDDAVAVVGFSNQFFNAVMIVFMMVSSGAGILIAQRLGSNRPREARLIGSMAVVLTGGLGVIVSVSLFFGAGWFAAVLQVPTEIRSLSGTYMSIVGGGMMLTAMNMALNTSIRNTGDTRTPMYGRLRDEHRSRRAERVVYFRRVGIPEVGIVRRCVVDGNRTLLWPYWTIDPSVQARLRPENRLDRVFPFPDHAIEGNLRIGWPLSVNGGSWTRVPACYLQLDRDDGRARTRGADVHEYDGIVRFYGGLVDGDGRSNQNRLFVRRGPTSGGLLQLLSRDGYRNGARYV